MLAGAVGVIAPARKGRKYLMVQNLITNLLFVSWNDDPSASAGVIIHQVNTAGGAAYLSSREFKWEDYGEALEGELRGLCGAASGNVFVTEIVEV